MKKKSYVIISLFIGLLLVSSSFGAYPTAEGLLRNGDNKDLVGDFIVAKVIIEEVPNEEALKRLRVDDNDDLIANLLTRKKASPKYLKFVLSVEGDTRADLLQLEYSDKGMKKSSLIKSKLIKSYRRQIRNDENIERALFNSILVMFLLNESKEIITTLHKAGVKFPTNNMVMNLDKKRLLSEYKKYLIAIKEDESLRGELISPIKPINEDEKEQAEEILKLNMYKKSEGVSLVRDGGRFFWQVEFDNFFAQFRNGKHRLDNLYVGIGAKKFSVRCGEYVLFNGVHELPTKILVKDSMERVYSVQMLSLSNFTNSGKRIYERARDYKKVEEENREKLEASHEQLPVETPFALIY